MTLDRQLEGLIFSIDNDELTAVARKLSEHYESEYGESYPEAAIVDGMKEWLNLRLSHLSNELVEVLSTPSRPEAKEFRRLLEGQAPVTPQAADVFSGHRLFSFEKLAAMVAYIAAHGKRVTKTKLNKLLFYSDFVNYYRTGSSISGARYVHLPYGPVPDGYENTLAKLGAIGTIQISERTGHTAIMGDDEDPLLDKLSLEETASIDWVLEKLGWMRAAEITEYSHSEKAYRFTRPGEPIAYAYAKFLNELPSIASHEESGQAQDQPLTYRFDHVAYLKAFHEGPTPAFPKKLPVYVGGEPTANAELIGDWYESELPPEVISRLESEELAFDVEIESPFGKPELAKIYIH